MSSGQPPRSKKLSVVLNGVSSISEGAKIVITEDNPDVSAGRPLGNGEAVAQPDVEDEKVDSESFAKKLLAPFRRKSVVDKLLLGETESLTRNPVRYGLDALVIHPNNRLKMLFDGMVQVLTLYSLSSAPLQFAFGARQRPRHTHTYTRTRNTHTRTHAHAC